VGKNDSIEESVRSKINQKSSMEEIKYEKDMPLNKKYQSKNIKLKENDQSKDIKIVEEKLESKQEFVKKQVVPANKPQPTQIHLKENLPKPPSQLPNSFPYAQPSESPPGDISQNTETKLFSFK
jgi:hypothetical protein